MENKMENKVTISELPELDDVQGTESIPVDSYDAVEEKNKTFRVSIDAIKAFVESGLDLGGVVTPEQILEWDAKETPQGAQDKADASLVLAKEYTDDELVAVNTAINNLTDLLTSDDATLDELQEIVDFIKLNRSDLDSLSIASIAGLEDALSLKADSATVTSALADKADVTALEGLATTESVTSALADKADVSALEGLATTESVTQALADKADVTALEGLATTESVTSALADKADVSALAHKADVSALEGLATTESVTLALADKADVSALEDKVDTATLTSALEGKADVSALDDKANVKNSFEVVTTDKTIVNADAGKILYIAEDCTLTVSDYDGLDDGFNCKIIVDAGVTTVAVEFTGTDSVRGDHTEITEDTTLIRTPNAGEFVFFGK